MESRPQSRTAMPLQKSFSEQNGSSRTRQHWNKNRSHSAVTHSTTTRNPAPKPLYPISEVTKNKLNAFKRSSPVKTSSQVASIEEPPNNARDSSIQVEKENDKQCLGKSTPLPASKESKSTNTSMNTATPVSRLAWQDLIGLNEAKEEEEDASPNERISWDTREDPHILKLSPVMPRRRGKKRARSSSPVSSPASNSESRTAAINVEKLSRALKSSHTDPALELWDRFSSGGSTSVTPLGAMNSALAQIMVSSSPRSSKTAGESGLRRAISCGEHWPKRRRVERTEAMRPMEVTAEESPSGHSKSSMVNALLKSVTGEINRSKAIQARQDALKSPSPRKRCSQSMVQANGSPTRRKSPSVPTPPLFTDKPVPSMEQTRPQTSVGDMSDYGDDDFDDDTLMELDASICQPHTERVQEDLAAPPAETGQIPDQQRSSRESISFDDEFADMDDDIFAAAAENLMTQVDLGTQSEGKTDTLPELAVTTQKNGTAAADLAEDVYGDDFGGDFDFEAAEIAATQSASSKETDGSLPVRRWQWD
ncbi:hypothetical protein F4677DRAFT_425925 [Hypoxylon crocopeplum]|nr:hypothetical protein F4677DRAFT_425925 [Hypoxylon crocopeplum]